MTQWTAALQASLSFTISWSLLKLISIDSGLDKCFRCPADHRKTAADPGDPGSYEWNTLVNGLSLDDFKNKLRQKYQGVFDGREVPVLADRDSFHGPAGGDRSKNILYLPLETKDKLKQ